MSRIEYVHYAHDVRVTKHPDARGMHRIRFVKPDGRPGEARRASWEDAHQLALELAGLLAKGRRPANGNTPIGVLAEQFLSPSAHREEPSPTYMRSSKSVIGKHIVPIIGDVPCNEWDTAVTQRVVDHCKAAGLADSTISGVVRTLAGIAKLGREHGYLQPGAEPTRGVYRHRKSYVDLAELPTADDIEAVAVAAAAVSGTWWRRLQVFTGAYSGLRIGEVLGLKVKDVNLKAGTIRVERQQMSAPGAGLRPPKYGSKRSTLFPEWLDGDYAALAAGRDRDEPLFPAARGDHELYSTFLNQRWRPAVMRAGWPRNESGRGYHWSYHDLRHYFCTWALAKDGLGLDVADVSRFAGHKSPQVTWEAYVMSRPDRVERARAASARGAR